MTLGNPPPQPTLKSPTIKILYSSWSDTILLTQTTPLEPPKLHYTGTTLTPTQTTHITSSVYLHSAFTTTNVNTTTVNFFGSAMHDGVRGYVISSSEEGGSDISRIVLFATDTEMNAGEKELHIYNVHADIEITNVKILSGGQVLFSTRARGAACHDERMLCLQSFEELRMYLGALDGVLEESRMEVVASRVPVQWCTNATTSVALMADARVYTCTFDPRYPKCLGRSYDGSSKYKIVPFLSETQVVKIASGGYLSAALGADGEMYVWGQVCPGSAGKLAVLEDAMLLEGGISARETGIDAEGEQDEFVKCLRVRIDGREARVYDVAIGHGHVVVAAEVVGVGGRVRNRAVFAAGDNSRSQLGVALRKEFIEEFEEITALRDERVTQLAAAGWSSHVVLHDNDIATQA
ncbi:hypothetical protein T440DRAFT_149777 [Plenodomus tracheiphilus IPT5]|uniref:RCC1/BLIP-II n=1 Tax=Plenodomus tracheiphilus IPT5 TaxID=1408161 RepID=A0A6A7B3H2_9PLEO|nr:hypothetical protein T440DRAFT_149777 [Plenodomus tracheiphilus IPT5]